MRTYNQEDRHEGAETDHGEHEHQLELELQVQPSVKPDHTLHRWVDVPDSEEVYGSIPSRHESIRVEPLRPVDLWVDVGLRAISVHEIFVACKYVADPGAASSEEEEEPHRDCEEKGVVHGDSPNAIIAAIFVMVTNT